MWQITSFLETTALFLMQLYRGQFCSQVLKPDKDSVTYWTVTLTSQGAWIQQKIATSYGEYNQNRALDAQAMSLAHKKGNKL